MYVVWLYAVFVCMILSVCVFYWRFSYIMVTLINISDECHPAISRIYCILDIYDLFWRKIRCTLYKRHGRTLSTLAPSWGSLRNKQDIPRSRTFLTIHLPSQMIPIHFYLLQSLNHLLSQPLELRAARNRRRWRFRQDSVYLGQWERELENKVWKIYKVFIANNQGK